MTWPLGSAPSAPTVRVDKREIESLACDADAVLAMLKRANLLVASAAIGVLDDETRLQSIAFVRESTALIRRIEGR